jgi:hypothetical protein
VLARPQVHAARGFMSIDAGCIPDSEVPGTAMSSGPYRAVAASKFTSETAIPANLAIR